MWTNDWKRNLAALWLGQALSMVAFSFFYPFIPLYIQTLDVHGTADAARWAGAISALPAVSMTLAQPFWGRMSDRWGRKPMVLRSISVNVVTTLMMGFAATAGQLLAIRTAQGLFTGTIAAMTALVAASMPKERVGFGLGALAMAAFVGTSVGPLIGGVIADSFGYRAAFFAAGAQMFLSVLIVAIFVREDFTPAPVETRRVSFWADSRSILAINLFPLLLGVIFLIQFANMTITPFLSLFIEEIGGRENAATSAGLVLAATGAVSAASALVVGRIGDRVGHAAVLPICLAGVALSYFPQALVSEVWQLLALRIATGAFLGGLMPSANALVADLVPHSRRGAAFGLTSSANAFSGAAGPFFGAGVATTVGMRAVFLATGAAYAAAWVWAVLGLRGKRARRAIPVPLAGLGRAGGPTA